MPNRTEASVTKAHSICHRETTVTAPVLYSTRLSSQYPVFGNGKSMTAMQRYILAAFCAVASLAVLRVVLPVFANLFVGLGVSLPLPRRLFEAHPRTALGILLVGGPVLMLGLLGMSLWLVYPRSR